MSERSALGDTEDLFDASKLGNKEDIFIIFLTAVSY